MDNYYTIELELNFKIEAIAYESFQFLRESETKVASSIDRPLSRYLITYFPVSDLSAIQSFDRTLRDLSKTLRKSLMCVVDDFESIVHVWNVRGTMAHIVKLVQDSSRITDETDIERAKFWTLENIGKGIAFLESANRQNYRINKQNEYVFGPYLFFFKNGVLQKPAKKNLLFVELPRKGQPDPYTKKTPPLVTQVSKFFQQLPTVPRDPSPAPVPRDPSPDPSPYPAPRDPSPYPEEEYDFTWNDMYSASPTD